MSPTPQTQFACLACNGVDNHEPTCRHADLHVRIAAAVAEARAGRGDWSGVMLRLRIAACGHADDVLARHRPAQIENDPHACLNCVMTRWPCPDVRALADLWLGKGWNDADQT